MKIFLNSDSYAVNNITGDDMKLLLNVFYAKIMKGYVAKCTDNFC